MRVRISPSGPFREVADPNAGHWAAAGTFGGPIHDENGLQLSPPLLDAQAGLAVPGLDALPWSMPTGYRYDFAASVAVAGTATAEVVVHIQVQHQGDPTWTSIENDPNRMAPHVGADDGPQGWGTTTVQVDAPAYAPATPIVAARVHVTIGTGDTKLHPGACSLRAVQYPAAPPT